MRSLGHARADQLTLHPVLGIRCELLPFVSARRFVLFGVALGAAFSLSSKAAITIPFPFNASFEATDGYSIGPRASDPVWVFFSGLAVSVSACAFDGAQALLITGNGSLSLQPTAESVGAGYPVTWLDYYMRPAFVAASDLPASLDSVASAVTGFVKLSVSEGEIYAVDGSGQGGGEWLATGHRTGLVDGRAAAWLRLSYRIDYHRKRWDLYVDGHPVLMDLHFADDTLNGFTRFSLRGDSSISTYFDYFYAGDVNPLFGDSNNDGLPDAWLAGYGLSGAMAARDADPDFDGLSNLEEYLLGLDPFGPDSDGDGVHDGREILRGTSPTVPQSFALGTLPYQDGFETDAVGGFANGTRAWAVQLAGSDGQAGVVATAPTEADGQRALSLVGQGVQMERPFAPSGNPVVWLDFLARLTPRETPPPDDLVRDFSAVFYVDAATSRLMLLDGSGIGGGIWRSVADVPVSISTQLSRYTLRLDYATQRWSLWLDGVRQAQDLGFAAAVPYFSSLGMSHGATQPSRFDRFSVTAAEPTALDNDGDTLPNAWERQHGLDPDAAADAGASLSGDGWSNLRKFQIGVDPAVNLRAALPFYEPFDNRTSGSLQGQGGWLVFGQTETAALVQTTTRYTGTKALELPPSAAPITAGHTFTIQAQPSVWYEFRLKPAVYSLTQTPELAPGARLGLAFREDGKILVYQPGSLNWQPLPDLAVNLEQWHRVVIRIDQAASHWYLYIDEILAGSALPLISPGQSFAGKLQFASGSVQSSFVDEVRIQATNPFGALDPLDSDANGLPDVWELAFFGLIGVKPFEIGASGLSHLSEYQGGLHPQKAAAIETLYVDGTYGNDHTYNGRSAWPGRPTITHGPKATLQGAFAAANSDDEIVVQHAAGRYAASHLDPAGRRLVLKPAGDVRIRP